MKIRKPNINYQDVEKYWYNGNAPLTYFTNALFTLFPQGEEFFVASVREHKDKLSGQEYEDVKKFIAQETLHGNQHLRLQKIIEETGFPINEFDSFYRQTAFLNDNSFLAWSKLFFGENISIAITSAIEHCTASLVFSLAKSNLFHLMPKSISDLLKWHSLEELEHKDIAFNVLQKVDPSLKTRYAGMAIGGGFLLAYIILGGIVYAATDKDFSIKKTLSDIPEMIKVNSGIFAGMITEILKYFEKDFHPNKLDDSEIRKGLEEALEDILVSFKYAQ